LKKKELASFAESAKELLKSVENSLETDNLNSLNTSKDDISEKTSKPYERAKILISVQDKEGTKQIRMFMVLILFYLIYFMLLMYLIFCGVVNIITQVKSSLVCLKCYTGCVSDLPFFPYFIRAAFL
jgi:hypothetical protein